MMVTAMETKKASLSSGTIPRMVVAAAIETGNEDGMQSFNQSLYSLIKSSDVSEKDGLHYSTNAEGLRMNLQGIFLDDTNRILGS